MSSLYNLVYVSNRPSSCDDEEIQNILTTSRKNNLKEKITGVLLHSENRFLQYLEGNKDEIMSLYERIAKDTRHTLCNILYHVPIPYRVFPSWQMGYKDLDYEINFQTEAGEKEYNLFQHLIEEDAYKDIEGLHILKIFFERV